MPEEQFGAASGGPAASKVLQPENASSGPSAEELFTSDEFRMFAYKILPCPKKTQHEWSTCPYSHPNEKARRRDPRIYNYLAIPCEATKQGGTCPRGDDCPNCHSLFEYWLHPSRYRTQLCRDMENGHCKRAVCFFAHSIEELRVPDHSHLNIPPEMQAAAAARSSGSSPTSTDAGAAASSDSSGSSTPRAASSDSKPSNARPPQHHSRAVAIGLDSCSPASRQGARGGGYRYSGGTSPVSGSFNSQPACLAASLEQQYAALQLQQSQMQAQAQAQARGLSPAGSLYEQQLQQMLLAAGAAQQAQQMQQAQLVQQAFQRGQQAAAWSAAANLSRHSMGSLAGGSPPLSPLPSGLLAGAASYGAEQQRVFVPPSANPNGSAMAAAAADWQSASLLRSLSTPVGTGLGSSLVRHSSGFAGVGVPPPPSPGGFNSCGSALQLHNSGGSSVQGQQDMSLAAFMASGQQVDSNWGAPGASAGMVGAGASTGGLSMGYPAQGGLGGLMLDSHTGLDPTSLLLQQQQQQKAALGGAGGLLGSDCNSQAMSDVLGMMVQQLMLQQGSAVM